MQETAKYGARHDTGGDCVNIAIKRNKITDAVLAMATKPNRGQIFLTLGEGGAWCGGIIRDSMS
jgi:hypothetical protein